MGASEAMQKNNGYTRVSLAGSASVMMLFLLNAIFRGAGDAVIAMKVLWFGNFINIVLNPCLIFGWGPFPEMGITGAAVGTVIGRSSGVAYQVWQLFRGPGRIRLTRAALGGHAYIDGLHGPVSGSDRVLLADAPGDVRRGGEA